MRLRIGGIAKDKRADAEERSVLADQRGAAPVERGRRGEDRAVEEIFPVSGERPARNHIGQRRVVAAAVVDHEYRVALDEAGRIAEGQRRSIERDDRAHERQSGCMVIADHRCRKLAAASVDQSDLFGLDDEVTDREHQAVGTDHDAGALALAAQRRRAARVWHRSSLHLDDGTEELLGVDACAGLSFRLADAECGERRREPEREHGRAQSSSQRRMRTGQSHGHLPTTLRRAAKPNVALHDEPLPRRPQARQSLDRPTATVFRRL